MDVTQDISAQKNILQLPSTVVEINYQNRKDIPPKKKSTVNCWYETLVQIPKPKLVVLLQQLNCTKLP